MATDDLQPILAGLDDPQDVVRLRAVKELNDLAPYGRLQHIGMTPAQGLAVLRAACRPDWPTAKSRFDRDPPTKLLGALCQAPHPEYLDPLLAQLDCFSGPAEWQALMLLSRLPQRRAAEVWVDRYRKLLHAGRGVPPPFADWARDGLHADLLVPALLEFASAAASSTFTDNDWLATHLYDHVFQYLTGGQGAAAQNALRRAYNALLPAIESAQQSPSAVAWRWRLPYVWKRFQAARLLAAFGFFPPSVVEPALRHAMDLADPRLRASAATSLLRLDLPVPATQLNSLAADPETRPLLRDFLRSQQQLRRFPRRFSTQPALAESDMVRWLIVDADAAPEEIAIIQHVDTPAGRHYVFRFRYDPSHAAAKDGWMAGISGPWPTAKGTRNISPSSTFSDFRPADSCTAEQHVDRILNSLPR